MKVVNEQICQKESHIIIYPSDLHKNIHQQIKTFENYFHHQFRRIEVSMDIQRTPEYMQVLSILPVNKYPVLFDNQYANSENLKESHSNVHNFFAPVAILGITKYNS